MSTRQKTPTPKNALDPQALATQIKQWARQLGFQHLGISDTQLAEAESHLNNWLQKGYHGEMAYMAKHGSKRSRPAELVPGTQTVIVARMDYFPATGQDAESVLAAKDLAYVSRYALGRDYHKVMRSRLQKLARLIETEIGPFGYRVFSDSAPVLEKALAEKAGLGWIGKHSNLLQEQTGSWFFLGEIYTDLPLPPDRPAAKHCGTCEACLPACPTKAIVAPYQVDARRCISYLTIELKGPIPVEFRQAMGNRIYGCDDCQLVCPWNRFTQASQEADFAPRQGLDARKLVDLFVWDEATFLRKTAGSAIRRIGYECWQRNIAVALGNAPPSAEVIATLDAKRDNSSDLVKEHIEWALRQQRAK